MSGHLRWVLQTPALSLLHAQFCGTLQRALLHIAAWLPAANNPLQIKPYALVTATLCCSATTVQKPFADQQHAYALVLASV